MKRSRTLKKVNKHLADFFQKNPEVFKALRAFGISYEQYERALGGVNFYTSTSTSPSGGYGQRVKHHK